jgi:hypothetical protein
MHVAHMTETRSTQEILVRIPEGKRPLGRSRCSSEGVVKVGLVDVVGVLTGFIWLMLDTSGAGAGGGRYRKHRFHKIQRNS